jgi:dipeptidyl aminopeptidase/acylaminoacyl peptidase
MVPVAADAEIRSVAWSEDGARLLLTIRRAADEHFGLAEVCASTGAVLRDLRAPGDVSGPLYLPGDDGIAFHVNQDGEVGVYVCDRRCNEHRRVGPDDGTSIITGFSPRGDTAWILHTGRISPPALVAVNLVSATMATIHEARVNAADDAVTGERIDVVSANRLRVPAYLWRAAPVPGREPAAIIRVRGGPAGQAMRGWDPAIQLLVQRGVHVISVNYRGSSGYGASYEQSPVRGHTERVADVLAARDFAERELGVAPERIVLLGHSYGALLVAEAVKREPRVTSVVLLSYVGPAGVSSDASNPRRIIAFHGEADVALPPGEARRRLEAILGR